MKARAFGKRAELILRALHIAVKNARNIKFDSEVDPKVREIPEYAEPATDNLETMDHVGTVAIVRPAGKASELVIKPDPFDESLPAVAALSYKPVDPRDPHWLERSEEGGRVLAQEETLRRVAEARAAREAAGKERNSRGEGRDASTAPRPPLRSEAAPLSMTGEREPASRVSMADATATAGQRTGQAKSAPGMPQPSQYSMANVDPIKRKPPVGVRAKTKNAAAPKERKNAAQRASAG